MSSTSPYAAARVGDGIEHTASKGWMVLGLVGGAIAGAALTIATGGVGTVVLASTIAAAAGGGGLGEVLGNMSWAPKHKTGVLLKGSPNVFINGRPAIIAHVSVGECDEHGPAPQRVAEGSSRVYINGFPAARIGDLLTCSASISEGSPNVFIGGDKVQTDDINPEIPDWVNWTLMAAGVGAVAVLATPAIALLGAAGSLGGGYAGDFIGGQIYGEGSDGQKWLSLGGSFAGGIAGAKGGIKLSSGRLNETNGVPISKEKFDEIISIPKGEKPDPSSYLPRKYIQEHAEEFSNGASRIVSKSDYNKYGIGKPDEWKSEFASSKKNMDAIIEETKNSETGMSDRLGIPKEQLENGDLLRIDFLPTEKYTPRIPTGNEFGARDTDPLWLPGGKLPNGDFEAVISTKDMKNGIDYKVYDFRNGDIYD